MQRRLVLSGWAALLFADEAWAAPPRKLDPLRVGVDIALVANGWAARMQQHFAADTGLATKLVPGASAGLLDALEAGELDAGLTLAPELEAKLDQQGLVHDRHEVTTIEFVLVGPVEKGRDPAGVASSPDVADAMRRIASAGAPFAGNMGGTGVHLLEQNLWRTAKLAPAAPWYHAADKADADVLSLAASQRAYALIDRALWAAKPARGLGIVVQGDARLRVPVHVMRPFRQQHPSAKLFVAWIAGPNGRRAAVEAPASKHRR